MRILPNILAVYIISCVFSGCGKSKGQKGGWGPAQRRPGVNELDPPGRNSPAVNEYDTPKRNPASVRRIYPPRGDIRPPRPAFKYPVVKSFLSDMDRSAATKPALIRTYMAHKNFGMCPTEYSLAVQGGGAPPLQQASEALATGSGTSLFKLGGKYLIKLITSTPDLIVDGLISERRIMRSMMAEQPGGAAKYGIANIYELKPSPRVSDICQLRMLVTDLLPGTSLMVRADQSPPLDTRSILKIAASALEALEKFHSSGFAHGDIHGGNFMIHELSPGRISLRLIDLGRARPFADEYGSHSLPQEKADIKAPIDAQFNYGILSPWHIESNLGAVYRSFRRDDLFRVAEMMFRISSGPFRENLEWESIYVRLSGSPWPLWKFKREAASRLAHPEIHQSLVRFYQYTLGLRFDEEPDYARWITEFNNAASGIGVPDHL
jgi:serine/threonine protein kinase